jgi:hypothetical protein
MNPHSLVRKAGGFRSKPQFGARQVSNLWAKYSTSPPVRPAAGAENVVFIGVFTVLTFLWTLALGVLKSSCRGSNRQSSEQSCHHINQPVALFTP